MASVTTYSLNLNSDDRKKYEEKLITADGTVFPDTYTLVENWKNNVKLLPDITWAKSIYVFRSLQLLRFWSCTRCCISWNQQFVRILLY